MHSYINFLAHCVFSTKNREKFLKPDIQSRLWPYLGGIARENKMKAISVGGVADHVHILLSIPSTLSLSKAIQIIKGNSSKWIRDTFLNMNHFAWQEGYGAFSIGISDIFRTIRYIQNQEKHHQSKTFQEELVLFLRKQGMNYDKMIFS